MSTKRCLIHGSLLSLLLLIGCQEDAAQPAPQDDMGQSAPDWGEEPPVWTRSAITFAPAPRDWILPLQERVRDAALADANGDGILDVVVLTEAGVQVLPGDGNISFALPEPMEPEPEEEPPAEEPPMEGMEPVKRPVVARLFGADLDHDGNPELVSCDDQGGALRVYPRGALTRGSDATLSRPFGCVMLGSGDFDGDGRDEVVELLDMGEGVLGVNLWRHDHDASEPLDAILDEGLAQELGAFSPVAIQAADTDGDGQEELILAESNRVVIFAFIDGALRQRGVISGLSKVRVLSVIDTDGDGDLDLHLGIPGAQDRLFLSDGQGRFAESTWSSLPVEDAYSSASVVIDLDQDGHDELVMGTSQGFDRLYYGSQDGRLLDISPALGFVDTDTMAIFAGDLDRDGDLDLVSVGKDGQLSLFARQSPAPTEAPNMEE